MWLMRVRDRTPTAALHFHSRLPGGRDAHECDRLTPGKRNGDSIIAVEGISPRGTVDRFAMLTQSPVMSSLEEKSRALARAAHAMVHCSRATVAIFSDERTEYAHSPPQGQGFTLRDDTPGLRRLLLPALAKFAVRGGYFVPHEAARALSGVSAYRPDSGLLVVPLKTAEGPVGALFSRWTRYPRMRCCVKYARSRILPPGW